MMAKKTVKNGEKLTRGAHRHGKNFAGMQAHISGDGKASKENGRRQHENVGGAWHGQLPSASCSNGYMLLPFAASAKNVGMEGRKLEGW